jgi:ABC-type polysaccharide/polyol phosphate export permease
MFPATIFMLPFPVVGMILDRSGTAAPYPPAAYLSMIYFFLAAAAVSFLCSLFVKETFKR